MNPCHYPACPASVDRIISASNIGAQSILSGECRKSVEFLSAAFEGLRSVMVQEQIGREDFQSSCDNTNIDHWMAKAPQEFDLGNQYVYTSPIFLPPNQEYCREELGLLAVVVSFNHALACLQMARVGGNCAEFQGRCLQQALKLFQYSFRLQRARGRSSQSPQYFMATVNNIGVLYSKLGETAKAEECFQQLLALIMYMNSTEVGVISKYGAFFQNASQTSCGGHGLLPSGSVAGAA